jgi:LacI family transcriptional regulator
MLTLSERPTAVLAANDETAAGILQVAQELGLRVPEDVSVVGFDDTPFAQVLSPRLSTVRQPLEQMAAEAVNMLMAWMERRERPDDEERTFPTELVLRESTAPAPGLLSQ